MTTTPPGKRRLDARAWLIWTLSAALLTMLTRNPLYILIILLAAQLVSMTWQQEDVAFKLPLLRMLSIILVFSSVFNMFFAHVGQTVLLALPQNWPLIGGAWTLEAAAYGAINGLMLFALLIVFMAFNNIVPGSDMVHLIPRAFHDLGLVVLIALTYVPETRRHWQKIREAQAIRGHEIRGWQDWRPVLLPLLVGGMERAMSLAEAMVSRGYGATKQVKQPLLVQGLLLLGLGAAFVGWLLSFWQGWPGWILMGSGVLVLLMLIWALGERVSLRRYESQRWSWRESVICITAVIPLILLLIPWPFMERSNLYFSPYPQLSLPAFDVLLGLALALLAVPGVLPRD